MISLPLLSSTGRCRRPCSFIIAMHCSTPVVGSTQAMVVAGVIMRLIGSDRICVSRS